VIRFSAFLVVAAVGTLIAGVVTSHLLLVYIAIGVSGVALLALGIGAAANWRELTSKPESARPAPAAAAQVVPPQVASPEPATAPAAAAAAGTAATRPAWSAAAPVASSRPSYLPPEPTRPVSPWSWRDDPAPREPATPAASLAGPRDSTSAVAEDQPSAPDDDLSVQDQTMIFRQPDQTMIFRAQADAPAAEPEPVDDLEPVAEVEPAEDSEPAAATASADSAEPSADTAAPAADDTASPDDAPSSDAIAAAAEASPADEPEPPDDATMVTKAAAPALDLEAHEAALEVTVVPGVPRYHKASCILIRFMGDSDLDKMTMAAATEAGCTPCRACLPDSDSAEPEPQA